MTTKGKWDRKPEKSSKFNRWRAHRLMILQLFSVMLTTSAFCYELVALPQDRSYVRMCTCVGLAGMPMNVCTNFSNVLKAKHCLAPLERSNNVYIRRA